MVPDYSRSTFWSGTVPRLSSASWNQGRELSLSTSAERVFTVITLLLYMGAFMSLATDEMASTADTSVGTPAFRVLWAVIALITFFFLLRCPGWWRWLVRERLIIAITLLACVSCLWASDPGFTLRRLVALIATLAFGIYLGTRYSLREQLRLAVIAFWIAILGSFIFGVLGVGKPVEVFSDAWNGVFLHKNALGRNMVLAFIVMVIAGHARIISNRLAITGACAALLLIALSRSATSVVLVLLLGAFYIGLWSGILNNTTRLIAVLLACFAVIWLVLFTFGGYASVVGAMGKDIGLSGRTDLWAESWDAAQQHPWLGYGYEGFWLGTDGPSRYIWKRLHWDVPHAHNGYIDLLLQLGWIGVGFMVIIIVVHLADALRFCWRRTTPENTWPFLVCWYMVLSNITESDLFRSHSLTLCLFIAGSVAVTVRRNGRSHMQLQAVGSGI